MDQTIPSMYKPLRFFSVAHTLAMLALLGGSVCLVRPAFGQLCTLLPSSEVAFSVNNLKVNTVRGTFGDVQGEVYFDRQQPENSHFKVSAAVSTISTGIGKRDKHLQEELFFHAEVYPRIEVVSSHVAHAAAEGVYHFEGQVVMKGTVRPFDTAFTVVERGEELEITGVFSLSRLDFRVGEGYSTFLAGEEVEVEVTLRCIMK